MTRCAFSFLLLGLGCGAPFSPAETCRASGITLHVEGRWQIGGRALAGCDWFAQLATMAVDYDLNLDTPADDASDSFAGDTARAPSPAVPHDAMAKITSGLEVWVHQDNAMIVCEGQYLNGWGCSDALHTIETNASGGPLAHEILHSYEKLMGVPIADQVAHVGWAERGWLAATQTWDLAARAEFEKRYCPETGTCG